MPGGFETRLIGPLGDETDEALEDLNDFVTTLCAVFVQREQHHISPTDPHLQLKLRRLTSMVRHEVGDNCGPIGVVCGVSQFGAPALGSR